MSEEAQAVTFTPKQQQYLSSTARFLLFGGGAGGGKTHVAIYDMLGLNNPGNGVRAIDVPEYTGLFLRRTMNELRDIIRRTQEIYPVWGADPKTGKKPRWYAQDKMWVFPSGARIFFGFVDRFEDWQQYQGWEYQTICFEELTQWPTSDVFMMLFSRLRKTAGNPVHLGMRATCNPGGPGHVWVKRFWQIPNDGAPTRFSVPTEIEIEGGEKEVVNLERQFIPALLDENPFLDRASYAAALEDPNMSEQLRNAMRYGRWDIVDARGKIYKVQMNRLHAANHIRSDIVHDPRHPVNTFWDLGTSDQTAIWFHQRINGADYFIDYEEADGRSLGDWWAELQRKPGYVYGCHFLPHDAEQRKHNLGGSLSTIVDILRELGMRNVTVVPRTTFLPQALEQARAILPRCFFNSQSCERGLECLSNYGYEVKADGSIGQKPKHDQYSHGADAFRQFTQIEHLLDDALGEYAAGQDRDLPDVPWARHKHARGRRTRGLIV